MTEVQIKIIIHLGPQILRFEHRVLLLILFALLASQDALMGDSLTAHIGFSELPKLITGIRFGISRKMAFSFFFVLKHGINLGVVKHFDPSLGFPGHFDPILLYFLLHIIMIIIKGSKFMVLIAYIIKYILLLLSTSLDVLS